MPKLHETHPDWDVDGRNEFQVPWLHKTHALRLVAPRNEDHVPALQLVHRITEAPSTLLHEPVAQFIQTPCVVAVAVVDHSPMLQRRH